MAQAILSQFTRDTKHRERHVRTDHQIQHMVRKFLATQIRIVPWEYAYRCVANDLDRIEFRAPAILSQYHTTRRIEPAVYAEICNNAVIKTLPAVIEALHPEPAQALTRFFWIGKNYAPQDLDALVDDPQAMVEFLNAYQLPEAAYANEIVEEVGAFLADLEFDHKWISEIYIVDFEPREKENVVQEAPAATTVSRVKLHVKNATPFEHTHISPILRQYAKQQQVGASFPLPTLVKQIVVIKAAPQHADLLEPLLGKRQYVEKLQAPQTTPEEWQSFLNIVDAVPNSRIEATMELPQVRAYMALSAEHTKKGARQLLKEMLHFHATQHETTPSKRQLRYLEEYPEVDRSVIENIL